MQAFFSADAFTASHKWPVKTNSCNCSFFKWAVTVVCFCTAHQGDDVTTSLRIIWGLAASLQRDAQQHKTSTKTSWDTLYALCLCLGHFVRTLPLPGTFCRHSVFTWDALYALCLCLGHSVRTLSLSGTLCTHSVFAWDALYALCLCLGHFVRTLPLPGTFCRHSVFTWDALYALCLCLGRSVRTLSLPGTLCTHPVFVWYTL